MANEPNTTRRDALKGAFALSVASATSAVASAQLIGLMDLIEKHRTYYALFNFLSPYGDSMDERYDPSKEGEIDAAGDAELKALTEIMDFPADTFTVVKAKAKYLAEIDDKGSLNYLQAFDFIHSIANI